MTPVDPDLTRLRRAFASLSDEDLTAACPAAEALWSGARGELPGPEVERLVEHIATCGACAELWRLAAEVEQPEAATVLAMPERRVRWRPAMGIAASLAVAAIGIYGARQLMVEPEVPPPVAEGPTPPVAVIPDVLKLEKPAVKISARHALLFRGETTGSDSFLTDATTAFDLYKADRFEAALPEFDSLARKYPQAAEPSFYKGVSLLMLNRAAQAIEPLKDARPLADEELARDADWYLALAYHRAGQLEQARAALRPICAATGAYAARACTALRELTPPPQRQP